MPLILNETDVQRVLPMDDLIDAMESALDQFSAGAVTQPLRTVLSIGAEKSFFGVMPAYVPASASLAIREGPADVAKQDLHHELLGTKLVTVFQGNAERGLPSHLATILLLDSDTGALLAILDGRYVTEARTAAVSAVSVRHLATPRETSTLCLLGSGVQAASHLEAISRVRRLDDVRVWSPDEPRRTAFVARMRARGFDALRATSSPEDAARGADLIAVATSATTPVLMNDWVQDGSHVMAVGACRPDHRELDPTLLARGRLVVDSRTGALAESGDVVLAITEGHITPSHIVGELGDVVAGRATGREMPTEVTVFKSLGMAVEDVVAAALAYRRATDAGLGTLVDI